MARMTCDLPADTRHYMTYDRSTDAVRTSGRRRHFLALDSLRGLCACCVALSHFHSDGFISQSIVIGQAYLFVDFFFVLSGFVIMASYGEKLRNGFSISRFMALRLGRIYPLHLAILLSMLLVQVLAAAVQFKTPGNHPAEGFFRTLFLVQIFSSKDIGEWNSPAWSIAAEMWAYLVFALAWRLAGKWQVAATVAVVLVAPILTPDYIFTLRYGALPRCCYGFGLGALSYVVWARAEPIAARANGRLWGAGEVLAAAAAFGALSLTSRTTTFFLCPVLFAALILMLAAERGPLSSLLVMRPFRTLGTLSYSIYMVHLFVLGRVGNAVHALHLEVANGDWGAGRWLVSRTAPFAFASDLLTLIGLSIIVATAFITFHLIEKPGRILSRRWLLQARGEDPVGAAVVGGR